MTERAEIERLLQMTGRTLEGLPDDYGDEKLKVWRSFRDGKFGHVKSFEMANQIMHQSDVIELLVGALRDALDKLPRWISVEDKLPETDEWVAVWYRDKDGDYFPTVGACRDGGDGLTYWETDVDMSERAYPPEKITHWMPLPEPKEAETQ